MIPISDSVRARSFPYVNVAIIVVNLLVFMYEVALSGDPTRFGRTELDVFIEHWANVPACTFDALGWDRIEARSQICVRQPEPLATLFTSLFMHGGWLHVGGNMLFLWVFGDNVEDAMGHVRYLVFYVLAGTAGSLAHGFADMGSTTPSLGASGAIAGVMGAYIVLFPRANIVVFLGLLLLPIPLPAFVVIGMWFVIDLFRGVATLGVETATGGVAYFAHIGGFVAGALLVSLFMLGRPRRREPLHRREQMW
jgi:membrane associated rhomboid family serine protease